VDSNTLIRDAIYRAYRLSYDLYGSDYKPSYATPTSGEDVILYLEALLGDLKENPRPCCIDVESMYVKEFGIKTFEYWHPDFRLWCVGFSIDDYQAITIPFDPDPYLIEKFNLCSIHTHPRIKELVTEILQLNCVTHSTSDALSFAAKYGIYFEDLDDSMLVQYAIDDTAGDLGVDDLAKFYTEEGGYKRKDFVIPEKLADLDYFKLALYCCHDSDIERRIFFTLKKIAEKEDVWRAYVNILKPSNMAGIQMTLNGCAIDLEKLAALIQKQEAKKTPLLEEFYKLPEVIRCLPYIQEKALTEKREGWKKKLASVTKLSDIKISKSWVLEILFYEVFGWKCPHTTEKGARSTDEDTLDKLKKEHGDPRVIDLVLQIKKIEKELSTYLLPYLEPKCGTGESDFTDEEIIERMKSGKVDRYPYIKADGLIHPRFNWHIARSGRSSSENPNFQNVKNDVDIKSIFIGRIWPE